jgi:hypothetical protein
LCLHDGVFSGAGRAFYYDRKLNASKFTVVK